MQRTEETNTDVLYAKVVRDDATVEDCLVLADALTERGDRAGERIRAAHALWAPDGSSDLLDAYADELGTFDPGDHVEVRYRWGFVDRVAVGPRASEGELQRTLEAIARSPECALVRHLTLSFSTERIRYSAPRNRIRDLFGALIRDGDAMPPTLRSLRFGTVHARRPYPLVTRDFEEMEAVDDLSQAWALFPHLTDLTLDPGFAAISLGAGPARELRDFEWIARDPGDHLHQICQLDAPNLARLVAWIGRYRSVNEAYEADEADFELDRREGTMRYEALQPLLAYADGLQHLETFGLANFVGPWGPLAPQLRKHPVFDRIETLDLSWGWIGTEEIRPLLEAIDGMSKLKRIVARGLYFDGDDTRERFEEGLGDIAIEGTPGFTPPSYYYVSVME